jgi:hypothetical protein
LKQTKKIWLPVLITIAVMTAVVVGGKINSQLQKASIFERSGEIANAGGDVYIPQNYLSSSGKVGAVEVKAGKNLSGVVGASFKVKWNTSRLSLVEGTVKDTSLDNGKFFTEINDKTPGVLTVLLATGGDGVSLSNGDSLFHLGLKIKEGLPLDTNIDLEITDFVLVQEASGGNLEEVGLTASNGKITIANQSEFKVVDVDNLSPTAVEIEFNDFIKSASIADVEFSPELKTGESIVAIDGKKLIITNLNQQIAGKQYLVKINSSLESNSTGEIAPDFDFAYFTGYPSEDLISSPFFIQRITAPSDNQLDIQFSQAVNPLSIEKVDFDALKLSVSEAKMGTNPTVVRLTTSDQSDLIANDLLSIASISDVWNLESVDGDSLSLNLAPIIPFGSTEVIKNAPVIKRAEAVKKDQVKITFTANVFASSATSGDLSQIYSLYEVDNFGNKLGPDLINSEVEADISQDYETVILSNLETRIGKRYLLEIEPDTVRNFDSDETITNFGNTAVFAGWKGLFTDSPLEIESLDVVKEDLIKVNFTKAVNPEVAIPPAFTILTSINGAVSELVVSEVNHSSRELELVTAEQLPGALYFLIVDPDGFEDQDHRLIGPKNVQAFYGHKAPELKVYSLSPATIENSEEQIIEIIGENFTSQSQVLIGGGEVEVSEFSENTLKIIIPTGFTEGIYDLEVVNPDGSRATLAKSLVVNTEEALIKVLSDESYSSPYRVSNENGQTRLWLRVEDPLGVSDIEKVTADLRPINGEAAALFSFGREMGDEYYDDRDVPRTSPIITDDKRWFYLDVSVPPTVATGSEPVKIEVIAENKSGVKAFGTVEFLITRNITASIAPEIVKAYVNPENIAPQQDSTLDFFAEIYDADGAEDISQVVIDLGSIGLGVRSMQLASGSTVDPQVESGSEGVFDDPEGAESPDLSEEEADLGSELGDSPICTEADYQIGQWSICVNGKKTRTVALAASVDCVEDLNERPVTQENCSLPECEASDWEPLGWSECVNGQEHRSFRLKDSANCLEGASRPEDETRSCETSFLDYLLASLVPTAKAQGIEPESQRAWYELRDLNLPSDILPGTYELTVTVIDREGEEAQEVITLRVLQNASGSPFIEEENIFATPRATAPNNAETPFKIHVKAEDPNGAEDIVSVTANFSALGIPPFLMERGANEGSGVWFSTHDITIPRSINSGHKRLYFTVTDRAGNSYKEDSFEFYVSDKTLDAEGPTIYSDRSYTTPRAAPNNEETRITFYVFVEEGDAPLSSVVINLGTLAKYQPQQAVSSSSSEEVDAANTIDEFSLNSFLVNTAQAQQEIAPTSSAATTFPQMQTASSNTDRLVTLNPSLREGATGQWFVISDIVVDKAAKASIEPYLIPVSAIDTNGNTAMGTVSLYVSDGVLPNAEVDMPFMQDAVATAPDMVEVLFSQPIATNRIRKEYFKITASDNINDILTIKEVYPSANGQIVHIRTEEQQMKEKEREVDFYYTITADNQKMGLRKPQLTSNQIEFPAYFKYYLHGGVRITRVEAKSANEVRVHFTQQLKYSSVRLEKIKIFEKGGGAKYLEISNVQFGNDGKTIVLTTAKQKAGTDYVITIDDIQNASGQKTVNQRSKMFSGFVPTLESSDLFARSDFNQDGVVDFLDFTIFSSFYGRSVDDKGEIMDLNQDGTVDFQDFTIFAMNFGKSNSRSDTEDSGFEPLDTEEEATTPVFDTSDFF